MSLEKRDDKIKLLMALEELKRRKRSAPLAYFVPHRRQQEVLDLLRTKRIVIMSGGNRVGKSKVAGTIAVEFAYGYMIHDAFRAGDAVLTEDGDYPPREEVPSKYWLRRLDGPPLRDQRSILVVTGLNLLRGIGEIMWPEIEDALPEAMRSKVKVNRGALGVPLRVEHPNGDWVIRFGSVEQQSITFEGSKHDAVLFDEPPSRSVYTAVWRGCIDYYASVVMTFTPYGANAPWMYEEFFTGERNDVGIVVAHQNENPHVTKQALEDFRAGVSFTQEEELARTSGEFGFLTHRAFQSYDPDVHLVEPFDIPYEWPRMCVCDPASRRPYFFLWLAYDTVNKTWVAYREWPYDKMHHEYRNSDWQISDYVNIVRNLEGREKMDARIIDPRFGVAEYSIKGQKTTSVCDDFHSFGMIWDPRVPDTGREETGIERVRQALHYDKQQPMGVFNRPHLLIFNTLKSLPNALVNYSFVPPNSKDDRILSEKLSEAFKDPIDALRYGLLWGPPARGDGRGGSGYISAKDLLHENAIDDDWL